jgi:MinD-like ATPase involved in chromosome partitioning or flagellar assembly
MPVVSTIGTKGGVGKSTLSMGIAIWTAKTHQDKWTLLIDGDMHIRSIELKMCPVCDVTLADVFEGKPLEEAIYVCELQSKGKILFPNLAILPAGGRFLPSMRGDPLKFVDDAKRRFDEVIEKLRKRFSYIYIDTPASMSFEHLILTAVADALLYVAEPNDDSVEATITTANGLKRFLDIPNLGAVLNRVPAYLEEEEWVQKLKKIMPVLGVVPFDDLVEDAFRRNLPVVAVYPNSSASRAIESVTTKILHQKIKPTKMEEKMERALERAAERIRRKRQKPRSS